jgi:hypothetical protein
VERRRRRVVGGAGLVAAAVLGFAGCVRSPATPAAAVSRAAATTAAIALAGPTTGDVLVQGTVRGADPSGGPTHVEVALWPQRDDTEVGERVELFQTQPVTVDAAGHWAVELDPATVSSTFLAGSPAFVNFDVMVEAGSTSAEWSSTAWLVDDGDVWRSEGARTGDQVIDVSMDLGTGQVTLTDSLGEAETSPLTLGTFGPPAD